MINTLRGHSTPSCLLEDSVPCSNMIMQLIFSVIFINNSLFKQYPSFKLLKMIKTTFFFFSNTNLMPLFSMSRWQTSLKIFFGDFALQAALLKYLDDFIGNCIRYSRNFWTMKKKRFFHFKYDMLSNFSWVMTKEYKKLMYISSQKTLMVKMWGFFLIACHKNSKFW